jgi:hypothetical protein
MVPLAYSRHETRAEEKAKQVEVRVRSRYM